jgi:hypothetical protein
VGDTDLLRRAAVRLREHANAATPGPWESLDEGDRLVAWKLDPAGQFNDDFDYVVDEPISNPANAAFIALMHPPVALALADLLDKQATFLDANPDRTVGEPLAAVARAVLREEEADRG